MTVELVAMFEPEQPRVSTLGRPLVHAPDDEAVTLRTKKVEKSHTTGSWRRRQNEAAWTFKVGAARSPDVYLLLMSSATVMVKDPVACWQTFLYSFLQLAKS